MTKIRSLVALLLVSLFPLVSHATPRIVTYTPGAAGGKAAGLERLGGKIVKNLPLINAVVVDFPDKTADAEILTAPDVAAVEEDRVVQWISETPQALALSYVSNSLAGIKAGELLLPIPEAADPKRAADPNELPWGVKRVNAPAAWNTTLGRGVRVAVIDTGIDYNHPDLKTNYSGGYNALDASKTPLDDNGHGTHVAGIIGAAADGSGVAGVAPGVSLYAIKVLSAQGSGSYSAIIDGIQWAVNNKISVANMSLGSPQGSEALRKAVEAAYKSGLTLVIAAGNDSGPVNYPAKYPQSIAVSASDSADKIAKFSSRGTEIAVIAPGVAINSTFMGGIYKSLSGTSMASPHVAGLAALAVSRGAKTPAAVRAALKKAAVSIGLQPEEEGAGLVDAAKLVR